MRDIDTRESRARRERSRSRDGGREGGRYEDARMLDVLAGIETTAVTAMTVVSAMSALIVATDVTVAGVNLRVPARFTSTQEKPMASTKIRSRTCSQMCAFQRAT